MKQLKSSFSQGKQAAQSGNSEQAYAQLGRALELAQELDQSGAVTQIRQKLLQPLSKKWGNQAIENKQWEEALTHFEKGIQYAENDAYMYYGKGLSLINTDSKEEGLKTLQKAIEMGNSTGNTRVTRLARERIQDEFNAKASKALNTENPSSSQIQTALDAIDQMTEYTEPNAKAMFYRARAYFESGDYRSAINTAQKGLGMHQGSRSDAAKYHFIVAESQLKMGNKETACNRFQQAKYGDYQARAEHYLENTCN